MANIFTTGSCLNFFLILREIYPEAEAYFNENHVITKISGCYYDINGEVSMKTVSEDNYSPFADYYPSKKAVVRAYNQMMKAEYQFKDTES